MVNRNIDHYENRRDLAAAFRLAVWNDWHESVANHFSVALPGDGNRFLINPKYRHFSRLTASMLVEVDGDDPSEMDRADGPDPTAFAIHGRVHAANQKARCVFHVHSEYATALTALAEPEIKPIDQNTARFFNRVAIDKDFGGLADGEDEANRIAEALGDKQCLLMGNHGVLVTGETIADTYDRLYYLERACKTLAIAYAMQQPLSVMPDDLAEKTAQGWERYPDMRIAHFEEMKLLLDAKEPDYAD